MLVTIVCASCTGNKPTPAAGSTGEQKGQYGVFYFVSVSRPVGGTIRSADGKIDCGTAGGTANACAPASYLWLEPATLSAITDDGQFFQAWAGDCSGAVADGGCILDTDTSGADKWVVAVFNPPDQLGHSRIPDPSQHSPLFFSFIRKEPGAPRCTNCHGAGYTGLANAPSCTDCHAAAGKPRWLQDCTFCHANPPASHGAGSTNCSQCHPDTVRADGTIDAAKGKHMNGVRDASCTACHGYPPATGAHRVHFGITSADLAVSVGTMGQSDLGTLETRFPTASPLSAPGQYAFGCGHCHPLDGLKHDDGTVDVTLVRPGTGSLKDRNDPAASYDPGTGTCSGVYCHSSGQASPEFRQTSGWKAPRLAPESRCVSCHDDPPSHANGNSHGGHVLGWPGRSHDFPGTFRPVPLRGSKHGGGLGYGSIDPMFIDPDSMAGTLDATPMTCQTCHFDTVDPRNTTLAPDGTPVGYYYLDTGGSLSGLCAPCHTPGGFPATGTGKALPLRHVNGTRDVRFDPRTGDRDGPAGQSLSDLPWLPAAYGTLEALGAPVKPTHPYWMTDEHTITWGCERSQEWYPGLWAVCPPGVVYTPNYGGSAQTGWGKAWYGMVEFSLDVATYDPGTKTCSGVACHLGSSSYPERKPTWGVRARSCFPCHR
jgi:predicted CxxxxCH...CXXCH cytochrome family protein